MARRDSPKRPPGSEWLLLLASSERLSGPAVSGVRRASTLISEPPSGAVAVHVRARGYAATRCGRPGCAGWRSIDCTTPFELLTRRQQERLLAAGRGPIIRRNIGRVLRVR